VSGGPLHRRVDESDRISFHMLNRETGHRLRREFVDSQSGKPVERDDQVKGYEVGKDEFIVLEPEEVAAAVPDSDKTLRIEAFIASDEIDDIYLDKPYYLTPSDRHADEAYALIREGMKAKKVAALAQTVLFRRVRTLLIRAHDDGLVASTLNFDYEIRSSKEVFDDVPSMTIKGEMLDLAKHIIETKRGKFDPSAFEDRYENALADLVKAKMEGRKIEKREAPERGKVIDLMDALRQSAGKKASSSKKAAASGRKKTAAAAPRRKAG
jgi:DNA end-binding protein Ku